MRKSLLHVKGGAKCYSTPCGCALSVNHRPHGRLTLDPCETHRERNIFRWSLLVDGTPITAYRGCGCELHYRGEREGSSYVPCDRHRSDYFAGLVSMGLLAGKEGT